MSGRLRERRLGCRRGGWRDWRGGNRWPILHFQGPISLCTRQTGKASTTDLVKNWSRISARVGMAARSASGVPRTMPHVPQSVSELITDDGEGRSGIWRKLAIKCCTGRFCAIPLVPSTQVRLYRSCEICGHFCWESPCRPTLPAGPAMVRIVREYV